MKPILALDFDGVCHSYTSGWEGADKISDPPVEGLFDFLQEADRLFQISIFSTRTGHPGGVDAMKEWFRVWARKEGRSLPTLRFPTEKPPALITLDDRAIQFRGAWPEVEKLREFKPWNKR